MFQEDSMGWGRLNLSDSRVACTRGLPLLAIRWDETLRNFLPFTHAGPCYTFGPCTFDCRLLSLIPLPWPHR